MKNTIDTNQIIANLKIKSMLALDSIEPEKGVEMQTTAGASCDWDFPVTMEPIQTTSGLRMNGYAVVDTRNGRVVGQYAKKESLLLNSELIGRLNAALDKLGFKYSIDHRTTNNGARYQATYTFEGIDQSFKGLGIRPQLIIKNSYDRSVLYMAQLAFKLLVCLNGMEGIQSFFSLQKRHSAKLDLRHLIQLLEAKITTMPDTSKLLEPLTSMEVDDATAHRVIANIASASKNTISANTASRILLNWHQPDKPETDQGRNAFRLLNAGTRLFRDLAPIRPTQAQRGLNFFVGAMVMAGRQGEGTYGNGWKQLNVEPTASASLIEV